MIDTEIYDKRNTQVGKYYEYYNTLTPEAHIMQTIAPTLSAAKYSGQELNVNIYDIEVTRAPGFPDPEIAEWPVDSNCVYNTKRNEIFLQLLLLTSHRVEFGFDLEKLEENIKSQVITQYEQLLIDEPEYKLNPDFETPSIIFRAYTSEGALLEDFWNYNMETRPLALIGFNSMGFDDTYVYMRTKKIFPRDFAKVMSEYSDIDIYSEFKFKIADYTLVDLMYLLKPVDSGGLGLYGKLIGGYSLNNFANKLFGIKKVDLLTGSYYLEYKDEAVNLLTYNIIDVILTYKTWIKTKVWDKTLPAAVRLNSPANLALTGKSRMFLMANDHNTKLDGKYRNYSSFNTHEYNSM